eukprot:220362-Karenia_brevis.AAC.1
MLEHYISVDVKGIMQLSRNSGREGESIAEYPMTNILCWEGHWIRAYESVNNLSYWSSSRREAVEIQQRLYD